VSVAAPARPICHCAGPPVLRVTECHVRKRLVSVVCASLEPLTAAEKEKAAGALIHQPPEVGECRGGRSTLTIDSKRRARHPDGSPGLSLGHDAKCAR